MCKVTVPAGTETDDAVILKSRSTTTTRAPDVAVLLDEHPDSAPATNTTSRLVAVRERARVSTLVDTAEGIGTWTRS
jgi:hypothetical protein